MSDDAPDPLAETDLKPCGHNGRCTVIARVALKREKPYGERNACTTHARVLMRAGWVYAGVLGGLLNWDPWY